MSFLYNIACASQWRGRRYLVSPLVDVMFAGGAAFVIIPLLFLLFPLDARGATGYQQIYYTSILFAVLAYIVNHPHFMASYYLMYEDFGTKVRTHLAQRSHMAWRYVFAGLIAPMILIAYLIYAFIAQDQKVFAWGIYVLFFTVGWHYAKQAFGVMLVLSAVKGIYYGRITRRILWVNAMLVWMKSWLGSNIYIPNMIAQPMNYHGVTHSSLELGIPPMLMEYLDVFLWFYGGLVLAALIGHSVRTRSRPSLSAVLGYSSMYSLLLLSRYHPLWAYMTPLFHSGQYLLFVWAYKRGEQVHHRGHAHTSNEDANLHIKRFILVCFLMGILSFTGVPKTLEWLTDHNGTRATGIMLPFLFSFSIFINIHHYFIDNVLWRKDNPKVGRYLMQRS